MNLFYFSSKIHFKMMGYKCFDDIYNSFLLNISTDEVF